MKKDFTRRKLKPPPASGRHPALSVAPQPLEGAPIFPGVLTSALTRRELLNVKFGEF